MRRRIGFFEALRLNRTLWPDLGCARGGDADRDKDNVPLARQGLLDEHDHII